MFKRSGPSVFVSAWTQTRLLGRSHYKTAPKKWLKTYYKKGKNVELINTKSRTAKEFDFLQEFQQRPVAAEPFPAPPAVQSHNSESHLSCLTVARGVIRLPGPLGKCRPLSKSAV